MDELLQGVQIIFYRVSTKTHNFPVVSIIIYSRTEIDFEKSSRGYYNSFPQKIINSEKVRPAPVRLERGIVEFNRRNRFFALLF